ncbi:MAG TPA: dihydroorotase [Flavisolibacter sp.]|jgi:dihydroorotase|nr:dihydroorotase [Flavisolibacter sp.]
MDILLKDVTVIDTASSFHRQQADIFIQKGFVTEIGSFDRSADKTISVNGLCIFPGFTDVFSNFCDPGFEYRETLETGAFAAAHGGYTDVFLIPNTQPVVSQKSGVEYIVQRSKSLPVSLHPIGAITKNAEGKELSEMYDMHQSGAVAFSDGICPVQSSGLLLKALQYVKAINKIIIQLPDEQSISAPGLMNEGVVSTQLGLPGKPAIAEELMISRDIELTRYTGSAIHFTGVSTAKGLEIIRKAKTKGLPVSCSVTPAHLYFTDEDLVGYDTNLKLSPPLRTATDRDALRTAVADGTVDCIASHHLPHHTDNKVVEFEYAKAGMIALESAFSLVRSSMPELSLERITELFSTTPRRLFQLPPATIALNQRARYSLFIPDEEWSPASFVSRSRNTPFIGKTLKGRPCGIIQEDKLFLKPL